MGRRGHVWPRKGRPGWWCEIAGRQHNLGEDKRAAEKAYHRLRAETSPRASGEYSVPDLVEIYLEDAHARVKPKTYKNYYEALQEFAADHSRIAPADLRAYHLSRWIAGKTKWNPSTRKTQGSAVKIWSAWIFSEDYVDADRLRSARLPESLKREAADPEELIRIEHTITDPYFKALWVVLYDSGARPGEIASLEASSVSWGTSTAVVDGKRGQRVIGLTGRAVEILRSTIASGLEGPILRTSRGALWSENVRRNHMEKWKARCKPAVSDDLTLYHCRHDLYRRWHAAGISDVIISRQMGHTLRGSPSLTLLVGVYAHSDAQALARAAQSACSASDREPTRKPRKA